MFRISHDAADLSRSLLSPTLSVGGVVTFEGIVRDLNEGQSVLALEYEAFEELAVKEGERVIEEAKQRFPILEAACVHRVGRLELGDIAIRVDVAAAHRREAFDACQYIVDQIKSRVPIWKKEHYAEGATGWINAQASPAEAEERAYYARQIRLPEVGVLGQEKLKTARVLVVGAGGLGSPALEYLAAAGVGTIGIAEGDRLDTSNLHRQPLYNYKDRGRPKTQLAAERLRALNPFVTILEHPQRVTAENALGLIADYDLVLDCTDNFATKFLLNDAAILAGKTLIQASIYQYEGQILAVGPGGPCLRCLWPEAPEEGCVGSCAEVGVLGVVPGVLGALQASEALRSILGLGPGRTGEITLFDLLSLETRKVRIPKNPACPVCGERPTITELNLEMKDWEVHPGADLSGFLLVDIREPDEILEEPLPGALAIPMDSLSGDDPRLRCDVLLVCQSGVRSEVLARRLRAAGHANIFSMIDGVRGVRG